MKWKNKQSTFKYNNIQDNIVTILGNIHGLTDIDKFLNPSKEELHSPYLLLKIEEVRDRIILAVKNSEKISIFSDP